MPASRVPRRIALARIPALDGLRGVAVAAVLLFHDGDLPGGFLGVDLFFALSGFLITSLLLAEAGATRRIDLARFWWRRARRLFPALGALLFGVAIYSAACADRADLAEIRHEAFATMLYVPNWYAVLGERDYWALFRAPSPLQHTWSLGIEEQFYLVWPLAIAALLAWRGRSARAVLVGSLALAAASAAWMAIAYDPADPSRVYYGTDTRAAPILLGAALASVQSLGGSARSRRARVALEVAGIAGAIAFGAAFWRFDGAEPTLYRGGFALCALASVAVIAAAAHPQRGPIACALSLPPLRRLGAISYGVYLWHWPVYLVLDTDRTGLSGAALLAARFAATALVALASYRFVELPIQRGALPWRTWRAIAPVGTAALVAAILGGTAGAVARSTPPQMAVASGTGGADAASLRVLVLGDSVGISLFSGLEHAGRAYRLAFSLGIQIGCEADVATPDCPPDWAAQVREQRPGAVLVVDSGVRSLVPLRDGARVFAIGTPGWDERWIQERQSKVDELVAAGAPRVVFTTLACFDPSWWQVMPRLSPENIAHANANLASLAKRNPGRVQLLDLAGYVCAGDRAAPDRAALRFDGIHFTDAGSEELGRWLAPQLARALGAAG